MHSAHDNRRISLVPNTGTVIYIYMYSCSIQPLLRTSSGTGNALFVGRMALSLHNRSHTISTTFPRRNGNLCDSRQPYWRFGSFPQTVGMGEGNCYWQQRSEEIAVSFMTRTMMKPRHCRSFLLCHIFLPNAAPGIAKNLNVCCYNPAVICW